jgi:hypothetical protein
MLVLDEVDELLDKGFKVQIYDVYCYLPCATQAVLLSATLPYDVLEMTTKFMTDPIRILVKQEELTLHSPPSLRQLARFLAVTFTASYPSLLHIHASVSLPSFPSAPFYSEDSPASPVSPENPIAALGSSGHHLFMSAFMIASRVVMFKAAQGVQGTGKRKKRVVIEIVNTVRPSSTRMDDSPDTRLKFSSSNCL